MQSRRPGKQASGSKMCHDRGNEDLMIVKVAASDEKTAAAFPSLN
jgi:hypothetical protein